jgi:hypothetical protein
MLFQWEPFHHHVPISLCPNFSNELFDCSTKIFAISLVARMDMEDIFADAIPCDDVVGYTSDSDAIEEELQAEQFGFACDLLGDAALGDPVEPATINPLEFVPVTPADFRTLSSRILAMCDGAKVEFVKLLITELTRSFRHRHLRHLVDRLRAAGGTLTAPAHKV